MTDWKKWLAALTVKGQNAPPLPEPVLCFVTSSANRLRWRWHGVNTEPASRGSAHFSSLFFPKKSRYLDCQMMTETGSVSLLAHPKPADPQQEKCQTDEVMVACSALAPCWVMHTHGWAQVRRTTWLACGSPSNNDRLFKPLSFRIACYLGKLTGPTFLSAPR